MIAPQYVELWLDHPAVGCGWRRYLVLRAGPKWVRLICTETAEALTIPRKHYKPRPVPLKRTRVARRLRKTAITFGLSSSSAVRAALAILRVGVTP